MPELPLGELILAFFATVFLLNLVDMVGAWKFVPILFAIGPKAHEERRTLDDVGSRIPVGTRIETSNGVFVFPRPDECLFRARFIWVPRYWEDVRFRSMLKLTIRWIGPDAHIVGRTPLAPVVFLSVWLLSWTGLSLAIVCSSWKGAVIGLPLGAGGLAFVLGLFRLWRRSERRHAQRLVDELVGALSAGPSSP